MNKLIITFALVLMTILISCKEDNPTIPSHYSKIQLEKDSNWIEIFDIDTIDLCFGTSYWSIKGMYEHIIVLKSEKEYKELFDDAVRLTKKDFYNCDTNYKSTRIEFDKRFLILYSISSTPCTWIRKIYYNAKLDEYLYLLEKKYDHKKNTYETLVSYSYQENITLPYITKNTKILFQEIKTYKEE